MTDKELRKLKKSELIEILYYLQKENEELKSEIEKITLDSQEKHMISDEDIQKIADAVAGKLKDVQKQEE